MQIDTINLIDKNIPTIDRFNTAHSSDILIQLFIATTDRVYIQSVLDAITRYIPNAHIIGASSDEVISPDTISNNAISISVIYFNHTTLKSAYIENNSNATVLVNKVVEDNTKLLISFTDAASINGELYLDEIHQNYPDLIVAGGLASTATFTDTFVVYKNSIIDAGAVIVSLNSNILQVHNDNSFGWQEIGQAFVITKAENNCVQEISGMSALAFYEQYLGKDVAESFPGVGSAFPLIIKRAELLIARGVIAVDGESVIVSGNVKVGDEVYIGYGNAQSILNKNRSIESIKKAMDQPEVILNYYCEGRKLFLPRAIVEYEHNLLNALAPTSGMFTLGEFYSDQQHNLLNFSSTLIALKEDENIVASNMQSISIPKMDSVGIISDGLMHFIDVRVEELKKLAYYDELTSLPNRSYFTRVLEHAIYIASKFNDSGTLFFIDLDNFKNINDTAGHFLGDKVLTTIAQRLNKLLDNAHTLCRFGGDEFVIVSNGINSHNEAIELAQDILHVIKKEIQISERTYYLTASIGIAFFSKENSDCDELIKEADIAMYNSKLHGRNRFSIYDESMGISAREHYAIEQEIRNGIKNREFILHYQPQFDMNTNEVVSVESLVRWNHPTKGLLFPDSFIEIAEISGLIIPLGEQIMDMALAFISTCKGLDKVAVNVSAKQFENARFFTMLTNTLAKYNFTPSNLELEMTESITVDDKGEIISLLNRIHAYGVTLSIDDFGTGYSSLSYLKRLPINTLKIDRSFIMDIPQDSNDVALTKTIIAMAKALDMVIIAEGIETQEQVDFLQAEGDIIAQGYFYSRPISETALVELLECK